MEDQKSITLTDASTTTMQHSFLCEDVRQALKQCKAPTDFHLIETHLPNDQKPCAPKYTSADLSVLPEMLMPQQRVRSGKSREKLSYSDKIQSQAKRTAKKKQPKQQKLLPTSSRMDSSDELVGSQLAGTSLSGSSANEASPDIPGMIPQRAEVLSQPSRSYKENVEERPRKSRPQTPDVPAFLKKFIQQQRNQQKRELQESNRDLSSSISLPPGRRRLPGKPSVLPHSSKSSKGENSVSGYTHQEGKAGTSSCLPHSPFKMKSYTMPRRPRDAEDSKMSRQIALRDDRGQVESRGCFGPHGPRFKKKISPPPSLAHHPHQPSSSSRPLTEKWQSESSRSWRGNGAPVNDGNGQFSVSRESLLAGLAGLKKVQDENIPVRQPARIPATKSRGAKAASYGAPKLDLRASLCDEIKKGVQLRKVVTAPPVSDGKRPRSQQEMRSNGGLSDELKKRVMSLRASMRQDSDSSDDGVDWD